MKTSASKPDLLSAALSYAKRGWPVFPLWPGNKTPLTKDGFKSASTDHDIVLAWWHQWPDANIGIATGVGFDVLDIDGPVGKASLHAFLREHDASFYLHRGPVSRTGKGLHLLFLPTGSGNAAGLVPNVDFRGTGGYIVAPPSLHPLGHHYAWDEAEKRNETAPLPEATPWLRVLLDRPRSNRTPAATRAVVTDRATPGIVARTLTQAGVLALSRPDIVSVARELGLYVIQQGNNWFARCPFHHGYATATVTAGTPSMMLDTVKNNFFCHNCQSYGDSLDLQARRDINGKTF